MAEIGKSITLAKSLLVDGEVVGVPTETVYGLAGNALNDSAVLKIFNVKNRPSFDPLIVHIGSESQLNLLATSVNDKAKLLIKEFWPGPLTLLLPKRKAVPDLVTSGLKRVAVRMPNHSLMLELLQDIDFPLAAPSANPFGYVSPTSPYHVEDQLGSKIKYILDGGECKIGLESTIVGFENEKTIIYRLGGLSIDEISEIVGTVEVRLNQSSNPSAPGMLSSHYSPTQKVVIGDIKKEIQIRDMDKTGIISFMKSYGYANEFILSPEGDIDEAARNLFKSLRSFSSEITEIIVELVPEKGLGRAINDRLKRAAKN